MARNYCWKTGCDVEATLSVIGGRWKPVLVCHLLDGRKRFGELRRLTPNATERMITLQLRELEADGVLSRHVFAEVPPRVEYEVTDFGQSLEPILVQMREWGRSFKERRFAEEPEAVAAAAGGLESSG
ncbi:MAG: helix-turn-helix domain-containing protein [Acidobacteriota bacterium]